MRATLNQPWRTPWTRLIIRCRRSRARTPRWLIVRLVRSWTPPIIASPCTTSPSWRGAPTSRGRSAPSWGRAAARRWITASRRGKSSALGRLASSLRRRTWRGWAAPRSTVIPAQKSHFSKVPKIQRSKAQESAAVRSSTDLDCSQVANSINLCNLTNFQKLMNVNRPMAQWFKTTLSMRKLQRFCVAQR